MKTACFLLAGLLGQAQGFDILAALHHKGHHHKKKASAKDDPTGMLSQIMAASSQGLAAAEKEHDKVVKQVRGDMDILLQKQVTTLSDYIKKLGADLSASAAAFEDAKETAQKALSASEAKALPAGSNRWDLSPDQLEQARMSTKINSADTLLKKVQRKRERTIDEAVSRCESLLEEDDGVRHLTRKVGDMTEMIKTAVAPLDEVGKAVVAEKPANKTSLLQNGQAMQMEKAQANLLSAQKKLDSSLAEAQKAFDASYDKVAKEFGASLKSFVDELDGEQKKELATVHGATEHLKIPEAPKKAKAMKVDKKVAAPKVDLKGKKHA